MLLLILVWLGTFFEFSYQDMLKFSDQNSSAPNEKLQYSIEDLEELFWTSLSENDAALSSPVSRISAKEKVLRSAKSLQRLRGRDAPHMCDLTSSLSRLASTGIGYAAAESACRSGVRYAHLHCDAPAFIFPC